MTTMNHELKKYTHEQIASICDHTFLMRPEVYREQVKRGESAIHMFKEQLISFLDETCNGKYTPYAVCVRAEDVPFTRKYLEKHSLKQIPIIAVSGFPHGSWYKPNFKAFEAQYAMSEGASEIDMVINYDALKGGDHSVVLHEVETVLNIVHRFGGRLKIILEISELNTRQIKHACQLATHAGVEFIKTSTGYSSHGVTTEHLKTIRANFRGGIKISGGVNAYNVHHLISLVTHSHDGKAKLDPMKVRIGESELLNQFSETSSIK